MRRWFRRIRCGCNMQDAGIYVSYYNGLLVLKKKVSPQIDGKDENRAALKSLKILQY